MAISSMGQSQASAQSLQSIAGEKGDGEQFFREPSNCAPGSSFGFHHPMNECAICLFVLDVLIMGIPSYFCIEEVMHYI